MINNTNYQRNKRYLLIIILILLISSFLIRLNHISTYSLWLDEAWRFEYSQVPREYYINSFLNKSYNFFGYENLIGQMVRFFGYSTIALRFPSILAGSFSVLCAFFLANYFFKKNIAYLCAILTLLNPLHIIYSQEAAAYTIGSCSLTLYVLLLLRKDNLKNVNNFIFLITLGYISALSYLYLLVFLIPCTLLRIFYIKKSRKEIFLCLIAIIALSIPQIYHLAHYSNLISRHIYISEILQSPYILSYPLRLFNSFFSFFYIYDNCFLCFKDIYSPSLKIFKDSFFINFYYLSLSIIILLITFASYYISKINKKYFILLFSTTVFIFFLIAQSAITQHAEVRYIVPLIPILNLFICSIAFYSKRKLLNILGYASLSILLVSFIFVNLTDNSQSIWKPDIRPLISKLKEGCTANKNNSVVITEFYEIPIYKFYLHKSDCNILYQPSFSDYFYEQKNVLFKNEDELNEENTLMVNMLIEKNSDMIFIISQRGKSRSRIIAETLFKNYSIVDTNNLNSVETIFLKNLKPKN